MKNVKENPTNINKLRSFQRRRAMKQKVFRKTRKDTWNKFINLLNSRTSTKKVWEKFKKVNGNYKPRRIPPIEKGGSIISTSDEIAETFAVHYTNISRDQNKERKQGNTEKGKKKKSYNTMNHSQKEVKSALNQQKNTTPGEDTIHPQMIKRLPPETLMHLLDIYNKIWKEGKIPKT